MNGQFQGLPQISEAEREAIQSGCIGAAIAGSQRRGLGTMDYQALAPAMLEV